MHVWFAVLAAVGTGANPLTGKGGEAIVTAIVQVENNHNTRLLTLGEFIAVTLRINPVPRCVHSIYIAALATLSETSGSVQQLLSLAPRQPSRERQTGPRLGGEGYESFRWAATGCAATVVAFAYVSGALCRGFK